MSILHLAVEIIGGELHTLILDYTTNLFILSFSYFYIVACKQLPFHFAVAVASASVILYSWYVALQTHMSLIYIVLLIGCRLSVFSIFPCHLLILFSSG